MLARHCPGTYFRTMISKLKRSLRHTNRALLLIFPLSAAAASLPTVPTSVHPVTNTYQSTAIVDNYQWLEDSPSPAVRDWVRLQNERTHQYFERLPLRDGIAQQLMQLRSEESARYTGLQWKI